MKIFKILLIAALVYVGIVVAFESLIGFVQPQNESTLVMTSTDPDGTSHDRVLTRLESDGKLYVAVNHWPRAWYKRILKNPEVEILLDGNKASYTAVPVAGDEHAKMKTEYPLGFGFRFLMGFAPRSFVRFDPVEETG